ncbi:MAG: response regulator transcription factor [Proteobacteria bacterium]|nr:response regulator transcription factor [Pseudomonadota bacterium]
MIEVCLVEDQALVREGIETLLNLTDDIRVTACATDGIEALEILRATKPDVVLLDIRMPRLDGLGVLKVLAQDPSCAAAVIILTTFDDDHSVLEGLRLGARGYLLKDVSFAKLTAAIRTVAAGGTLVSPAVTERLLRGLHTRPVKPSNVQLEDLTPRELEVLRLMSGGFSNAEIASALNLTEGTVKNHVSSILAKLNTRDRVRAILKGIECGLV